MKHIIGSTAWIIIWGLTGHSSLWRLDNLSLLSITELILQWLILRVFIALFHPQRDVLLRVNTKLLLWRNLLEAQTEVAVSKCFSVQLRIQIYCLMCSIDPKGIQHPKVNWLKMQFVKSTFSTASFQLFSSLSTTHSSISATATRCFWRNMLYLGSS